MQRSPRIYLEETEGVPREVLAQFSTLEPATDRWYTIDARISRAWQLGVEVGRASAPIEETFEELATDPVADYLQWVSIFTLTATQVVGEVSTIAHQRQATSALNGFIRTLRMRSEVYRDLHVYQRVDRYFSERDFAEATERIYRQWIAKVLERMEMR